MSYPILNFYPPSTLILRTKLILKSLDHASSGLAIYWLIFRSSQVESQSHIISKEIVCSENIQERVWFFWYSSTLFKFVVCGCVVRRERGGNKQCENERALATRCVSRDLRPLQFPGARVRAVHGVLGEKVEYDTELFVCLPSASSLKRSQSTTYFSFSHVFTATINNKMQYLMTFRDFVYVWLQIDHLEKNKFTIPNSTFYYLRGNALNSQT